MRTPHSLPAVALMLAALFVGCSFGVDNEWQVVPGAIWDARVEIDGHLVANPRSFAPPGMDLHEGPVSVQLGVPFEVVVHTHGSIMSHRPAPSEVDLRGHEAVIAVFDFVPGDGRPSDAGWSLHPRTDTVLFTAPGEAEVVIHGSTGGPDREPYELRFSVIVSE